MKEIKLKNTNIYVPAVAVGCMRLITLDKKQASKFINNAINLGAYFFDHADIYGDGECEKLFSHCIKDNNIKRENLFIQSKCGIRKGYYDFSKQHILSSVDNILQRLKCDYLDSLLLHRPDALCDPNEVSDAFDILYESGKVRHFGVSNHNPMQIELLKKHINQDLIFNQLQLSIPVANMIASGLEVNMDTPGSFNRDGSVLDYSRLNDITIQTWSSFQMSNWRGCFIGNDEYKELNQELAILAEKYNTSTSAIAAAWVFTHPANMQLVTGTMNSKRLEEILLASKIKLSRQEWYSLYLKAGYILP